MHSPTWILWLLSCWCGLGLSLVSLTKAAATEDGCPSGLPYTTTVKVFRDKCYQFVHVEKYWPAARDYCWRYGGKLVKIADPETNSFILSSLAALPWRNNGVWIGLHDRDQESGFAWVTEQISGRERVSWTNWASDHPGGFWSGVRDCVRITRPDGWKWHESPCSSLKWYYRFICEYPMLETSSVAPSGQFGASVKKSTASISSSSHGKDSDKTTTTASSPDAGIVVSKLYGGWQGNRMTGTNNTSRSQLVTLNWNSRKYTYSMPGSKPTGEPSKQAVLIGVNPAHAAALSPEEQGKDGIPMFAIIIAFAAGIACTLIIVLVVFVRRRRKKHSESDSITNPAYDDSVQMTTVDGATGGSCEQVACKGDVDDVCCASGGNAVVTAAGNNGAHAPRNSREKRMVRKEVEPNIYVETEIADPRKLGAEQRQNELNMESTLSSGREKATLGSGTAPVGGEGTVYLPMDSSGSHSHGYVPMKSSGGKQGVSLPPVPGEDGYEVPTGSEPRSNTYAEIPEGEENIYSTIAEVKKYTR